MRQNNGKQVEYFCERTENHQRVGIAVVIECLQTEGRIYKGTLGTCRTFKLRPLELLKRVYLELLLTTVLLNWGLWYSWNYKFLQRKSIFDKKRFVWKTMDKNGCLKQRA